ncbi:trifunctional serine/threonine-protein kinase/ATP-binding protein/sensor histidine kinase [Variovorax sp. LT1R16]|uniref:trifunctional serine/threonine-protein kinase/ATP-binding protein/sensor histidine kinase n=1 Tax=Variovorax sp. LT1R16 TaxID=3443728 RepID=UPI003F45BA0E
MDAELDEILCWNERTRVVRRRAASGQGHTICKQAIGPDALERMRHERRILEHLDAVADVPKLVAQTSPDDTLAVESVPCVALVDALRVAPLEVPELLSIALLLARVVAAVHRAGVIHRDINPSNIVLCGADRRPMLIDFDRATLFAEQQPGFTQPVEIAGTLAYLAPEVTGRTSRTVDQRADLYSLGATFYELATGRPPFEAGDALQLIYDHLVREPTAPVELDARLPQGLSDIILRLLAKEPDARYQSAHGLVHDLSRLGAALQCGDCSAFALGERDFAARLAPPSRLVGRQSEIASLKRAFENALHGGSRGVLVSGAPGVGKSSLINELRPMVAARHGWFVSGKFDSQRQDVASDGAYQALRALGRMLLAEPETELRTLRERIALALGPAGCRQMARVPEMALLLGQQPDLAEPDLLTAKQQTVEVALDLFRTVASPARPVVMVLDDLQWAAALPIALVHAMLTDGSLNGLLLVGAYRDGEVDALSPLASMLPRWARLDPPPLSLTLQNLPPAELATLLAEMLRLVPAQAALLAQALRAHTDGNPFDTVQLVDALRRDGALVLDEGGWTWDAKVIARHIGRGNVVDLLARRVAALTPGTQQVLDVMACLGGEVELPLLQAASGASAEELEQRLAPALEDRLLAMQHEGLPAVRFAHDRVQQACLERIVPAERGQLHLALARRLGELPEFEATAAHQYLPALDAIDDPSECLRVATLLHRASGQMSAFNPAVAERFLSGALALFGRTGQPAAVLLSLHIERHALLYNLGRLDEANALYASIEQGCTDPLQLADAACVQISSLTNQARPHEAVALGTVVLARLGQALPSREQLGALMGQGSAVLSRWLDPATLAADLQRPNASDPHALAAGRLLKHMAAPSFFCDPAILVSLVLAGQRLWIEHGPAAQFVGPLSVAAFVCIGAWQDYRTGMAVVRRMLDVSEVRGYHPEASQARFHIAFASGHWAISLEDNAREAQRAREGLLQGGDLFDACFTYAPSIDSLLDSAPLLERCAAETDAALAFAARTGNDAAAASFVSPRQLVRMLQGATEGLGSFDDAVFNEASHLAGLGANLVAAANFHARRALGAAFAGDIPVLVSHAAAAMPLLAAVPGTYLTAIAHLVQALALAQRARTATPEELTLCLGELDACHDWLALRAADAPGNFLHLVRWIEAERAWAIGDFGGAARAFDAAQELVESRQRPWHQALITERAALCLLEHGLQRSGEKLMAEARRHYAQWGATAKVHALDRTHAFLRSATSATSASEPARPGSSIGSTGDAIDMLGVLRASQALSSQTSLGGLKSSVVKLLGTMTGATSVLLALWNEEQKQWLLSTTSDDQAAPVTVEAGGARGLLPLSAFRYAERTLEPLLVEDATQDDRFLQDPYVAGLERCSLLVIPILSQGVPRAVLLLENRLSRGAFSAGRLDAVTLIAGQLAVSLENALLYQELEQRVEQRTLELRHAQAELVGTARRAGMAEIATNVLHNVGNILNSVNVSANVVSAKLRASKSKGLSQAMQLMDAHSADLGHFLTQDAKGRLLPDYLRKVAQALALEHQEVIEELGHLSTSVDHIKNVVATQQSYAGNSSVLEPVQLGELVDDALRMNDDSLARHQVTVVKEFAPVPLAQLDKTRVIQILVNLISNAKQAMGGVSQAEHRITLQVDVVGNSLRVRVKDDGVGIASENLTRIFGHGFTTRKAGHGFGLHSCALAAKQMGGTLTAYSDGPGKGALFTLELPLAGSGTSSRHVTEEAP